jgi:formylglycine-generating enzyme required for sulfatase activity
MPRVKEILPPPFDWCEIPAGKMDLGKGHIATAFGVGQSFDVPTFLMAKYPITNAQFAKFINVGGYRNKQWWTEQGWKVKEEGQKFDKSSADFKATGEAWTEPRLWKNSKWSASEQPVVGVSWYEAIAFCKWLSSVSGEKIILPTEQQWQRAAQGDDGRIYPWGNDWDASNCNNYLDRIGIFQSSTVQHYEGKGDSPFNVVDMAGNVWEWCLNEYETGNTKFDGSMWRGLRGGSWLNINTLSFRVDSRMGDYPNYENGAIGFRIALNLE